MINLANGAIVNQTEIPWVENKASALIWLNIQSFSEGEIKIVGYKIGETRKDIMMAVGIANGMGPDFYRVIIDKGVLVVAEVLDYMPDPYYVALNQRYLVRDTDGLLYLIRRHQTEGGTIIIDKTKVEDKTLVVEATTGDIYICNPPQLTNLLDTIAVPGFVDVLDTGLGGVKVSLTSAGVLYENQYFLTEDARGIITRDVFDENLQLTLTAIKHDTQGAATTSMDPLQVVEIEFQLEAKWKGERVRLSETPTGWTYRTATGIYIKRFSGNNTVESGDINCVYTVDSYTGMKTVKSLRCEMGKYIFLKYKES
ncbi:MAG: hypothetical protein HUJ56_12155, partial [Erysipelotrichaceae bacterium]|nr:hypothetical protein [Erysipelotrichaceae bacterium]